MCHRVRFAASDAPDAGLTLIEVIVSFVVFAIVAGSAITAIINSLQATHVSQQRVDAANVAQAYLASLRANPDAVSANPSSFTANLETEEFTVVPTITFAGSATQCGTGGSFTVNVVVDQKQTGKFLARSDTVIAC